MPGVAIHFRDGVKVKSRAVTRVETKIILAALKSKPVLTVNKWAFYCNAPNRAHLT
jgi:hypothetical protein